MIEITLKTITIHNEVLTNQTVKISNESWKKFWDFDDPDNSFVPYVVKKAKLTGNYKHRISSHRSKKVILTNIDIDSITNRLYAC